MAFFVFFQIVILRKTFRAHITRVRFFAGMSHRVTHQMESIQKFVRTQWTLKLSVCIYTKKILILIKNKKKTNNWIKVFLYNAEETCYEPFVKMNFKMLNKTIFVRNNFLAIITFKSGMYVIMDPFMCIDVRRKFAACRTYSFVSFPFSFFSFVCSQREARSIRFLWTTSFTAI